jgi:hypothetical protein
MTSGGSRRFGKLGQFLAQFNTALRPSIVSRLRLLVAVLTLTPSSRLSAAVVACDRYIVALMACVVVAQASLTCPIMLPSKLEKRSHHQAVGSNTVVALLGGRLSRHGPYSF